MTTKPLTPINFNVSNSTPQSFQAPQSYSTSENEPPQTFSAPGSPDKLSPKHTLNSQGPRQALSPSSTYNPLMPQRANTENNDNQMMGLFDIYNKTEGCSVEEPAVSQSAKKGGNAGNFKRFVDDMKTEKRSLSAEKSYKCGTPVSKAIGLWAKENIPDASDKGTPGIKKKPRNSTEQVNRSVGGEAMIRFDNRKLKSTRRDVDSDVDTNGRYNTEEDRAEGLFDEDYFDKEAFMRDGPVRYSKMSEEDAATIFEIRRKELLSFLTKLGASSAVSKKKFVNKNVGGSRLGTANQNSDVGKNDFHREKGVRRLPDSLKENNSPTRFIIYNTTSDSNTLWNTNTSTQAGKFATPAKDKKVASAVKAGYESAPDEKRMREREELSPLVERNLEASFNQIVEWNDGMEKRSPVKVMKKTESTMKSYEEKVDVIENITIDLTKMAKLKKKKKKGSKKMKSEEEKWYTSEKVNVGKQVNEDVSFNQGYEQMEVKVQSQVQMQGQVESKVVQKNLEVIKKKNLSVMNEIADLDNQIERMRESDNRALLSYRRIEDERELVRKREESKRVLYDDGSHEGYLHAARMKKSAERSRSMSIKQLAVRENLKHNESMVENYSRGGLRNRDNIGEEDIGNQSRRNQKVRFADDLTSSSKNSSQISQKEIKEKTLVRVPSQTNTSGGNTVKVDLNKQNKTKAPTQKRALSNNTTSSRNVQQDTNLTLSTISSPKNAKDFQLKNLDLGRTSAGLNNSFNVKTSQTTTNKSSEKIKFGGDLNGSRTKDSQQPMQQLKTKKISRTSETNSTLPSVRESMLTSPKELTFSLRKTPVSCSTPIPVVKKELSNCAPAANNNKPVIKTKKPANKSISIKSNYRSVSDKDCSTEIPNLFEGSTPIHETASAAPKIFFSKEVKRIIRDGSKDEKPAVSKPKQAKSKEPVKTNKDTQSKVKKGEVNRPDFDLNSSVSIRAKILRQSRPGQENLSFLKASASPSNLSDSSKLDMKPFALEDFGISPAASQVKKLPFKKSETDKNLLRKGSLSTPRGFKVVTSPTATTTRGCLGLSLQDMKEKLAEQACVEMDEDNESLDSFRLREKSLNLPLQPAQGKQQGQNGKGQESKETQAMKRKKAAGYSVC